MFGDMRVLGIDYGRERVGVALGDTETRLASPWTVVHAKTNPEVVAALCEIVLRERVTRIVVGVPRPLDGSPYANAQLEEVRAFIEALRALDVGIEEEDERLTSRLAAAQVRERGEKGKRDDLAAAAILQSWLDRQARTSHAVSP